MHPAALRRDAGGVPERSGARAGPATAGRRLLVVPSEPLYHPRLHEALEAAGALVVAEDDWWGSRAAGRDIPDDGPPLAAIFEKYFADAPTLEVSPRAPREAWLREQIERGDVDGVVFYVPPVRPPVRLVLPAPQGVPGRARGPSLLLRQDVLDEGGRATISAAAAISWAGRAVRGRGWLEGRPDDHDRCGARGVPAASPGAHPARGLADAARVPARVVRRAARARSSSRAART